MWLVQSLLVLFPLLFADTSAFVELKNLLAAGKVEEKVFVHSANSDNMVPAVRKLSLPAIDYLSENRQILVAAFNPEAKNRNVKVPQPLHQNQFEFKSITLTKFREELLPYFSPTEIRRLQFLLSRVKPPTK